ncbi:MAG: DUF4139 domain-containing protein [Pseudomonadota bacterium]|nr:DUF4139 domain-containing protein [Pseudomonadota bacterium]
MRISPRTVHGLALAGTIAWLGTWPVRAADTAALTVYRSDDHALYASNGGGQVDDGYAVVREQRTLTLAAGTHDVAIDSLPTFLDPEALALDFPDRGARVLSQRLRLAQGGAAALTGLLGHSIDVLGSNGALIVQGILLRAGDSLLVRDQLGRTVLVGKYAAVRTSGGDFPTGSTLELRVDTAHAGTDRAVLSYPTSGLGWRAAYVATLQPGAGCRMQFESRASIANRSGRDWHDVQLTLVAGAPNMARAAAPRPMVGMARGFTARAANEPLPLQQGLGDYRSYTLPSVVDLPDASVSQVPLYATRTIGCVRTALYENGNAFRPRQPMLNPDFNIGGGSAIVSTLRLKAFDSLPAGYLRVLTADSRGVPQFIGEGRIDDTPRGSDASITLGTAFDLRAERRRTRFSVDRQGRTMDEAFRIELSNAGDSSRTVTVREHPSRWQQWRLVSSSSKPSQQTADTLEFRVEVPAGGKATLDYAVRYHWSADDNPQP